MTRTINLSLSQEEVQALLGLLDHAVKAAGLSAAQNAAFFLQKIQALQRAAEDKVPRPETAQ